MNKQDKQLYVGSIYVKSQPNTTKQTLKVQVKIKSIYEDLKNPSIFTQYIRISSNQNHYSINAQFDTKIDIVITSEVFKN